MNSKFLPVLAILVTGFLAAAAAIGASQYTQGNVEARVAANEQGIASFDKILRSIDRRLAHIEGLMDRQP